MPRNAEFDKCKHVFNSGEQGEKSQHEPRKQTTQETSEPGAEYHLWYSKRDFLTDMSETNNDQKHMKKSIRFFMHRSRQYSETIPNDSQGTVFFFIPSK